MLEVRLQTSLQKLEFLMEAVDKIKGELADLETSRGKCFPDLPVTLANKTEKII